MINYLVRVELHHDEHNADYTLLHEELYKLRFFRVSLMEGRAGWHDLPTAKYLNLLSTRNDLQTLELIENLVKAIIRKHKQYADIDIQHCYSIMVTRVTTNSNDQLLMQVHLQPTTDATKLPQGATL